MCAFPACTQNLRQFLRAAAKDPSTLAGGGGGGGRGKGKGAGQGGSASPVVEDGSMRLPDGRVNQNITCEHGTLIGGCENAFFCFVFLLSSRERCDFFF